jgi:hypothetical protein
MSIGLEDEVIYANVIFGEKKPGTGSSYSYHKRLSADFELLFSRENAENFLKEIFLEEMDKVIQRGRVYDLDLTGINMLKERLIKKEVKTNLCIPIRHKKQRFIAGECFIKNIDSSGAEINFNIMNGSLISKNKNELREKALLFAEETLTDKEIEKLKSLYLYLLVKNTLNKNKGSYASYSLMEFIIRTSNGFPINAGDFISVHNTNFRENDKARDLIALTGYLDMYLTLDERETIFQNLVFDITHRTAKDSLKIKLKKDLNFAKSLLNKDLI